MREKLVAFSSTMMPPREKGVKLTAGEMFVEETV
jgi:hypothetical protein